MGHFGFGEEARGRFGSPLLASRSKSNHRSLNGRDRPSASGAAGAKCTASALQHMAFSPIKYIIPGSWSKDARYLRALQS